MDIRALDITDIKKHEDDIIIAFVDFLMNEDFEERYYPDELDADEIYMSVSIDKRLVFEYGKIDDESYVTVIPYKLQYYGEDTRLNIIDEFESICEEYRRG